MYSYPWRTVSPSTKLVDRVKWYIHSTEFKRGDII